MFYCLLTFHYELRPPGILHVPIWPSAQFKFETPDLTVWAQARSRPRLPKSPPLMTSLTKNPHPDQNIFFECKLQDLLHLLTGSIALTGLEKFPCKTTCVFVFFFKNPQSSQTPKCHREKLPGCSPWLWAHLQYKISKTGTISWLRATCDTAVLAQTAWSRTDTKVLFCCFQVKNFEPET